MPDQFLKDLLATPGTSGFEQDVQECMAVLFDAIQRLCAANPRDSSALGRYQTQHHQGALVDYLRCHGA